MVSSLGQFWRAPRPRISIVLQFPDLACAEEAEFSHGQHALTICGQLACRRFP
jgi:hypothetical protein